MAIPLALVFFVRRRKDRPKPFPIVFWLVGAFIVACGLTHLNEAVIFWHPYYRFAGLVKVITALVSWLTPVRFETPLGLGTILLYRGRHHVRGQHTGSR